MKSKYIIAIDGYSSTGKSSISKAIAEKLGIIHIDTGALYRGITYLGLKTCFQDDKIDIKALEAKLPETKLHFKNVHGTLHLFLNEKDIEKEIRAPKVSHFVSNIAKESVVRAYLLQIQHDMAKEESVIMDGRDIGTIIFPDADYKFFLTASTEERAKRRWNELKQQGVETSIEEVKQNLLKRDKMDSERKIAPLKKAEDAILIDNTHINKEETIDLILTYLV